MRGFLLVMILPLFFGSCLKKIEEADNLNTNIFDRDYTGDQWYVINDTYQITNDLGQIKARIEVSIPQENVPELKPSNIKVHVEGDGLPVTVIDFPKSGGAGNYDAIVDLPYNGLITYCITLGIYVEEEDAAINLFEECFQL